MTDDQMVLLLSVFWWLVVLFKPGDLPEWMTHRPFKYSRNSLAVITTICLAIAMLKNFG